jgi:transcription termination factor Rho
MKDAVNKVSLIQRPDFDFAKLSIQELQDLAHRYGVIGSRYMNKEDLIVKIKELDENPEKEIEVMGILEKIPDGYGFLRLLRSDYMSSNDDVYVAPNLIRKYNLRAGDTIFGVIKRPREGEKYFALTKINTINFLSPTHTFERPIFEYLTPIHPTKKFNLEDSPYISMRLMDIFSPIGKGQRGLIVAPPKAGKTILLKELADTLGRNHPEVFVIVLLIDERPEEVADMRHSIRHSNVEIVSSTFDESAERHTQVAEAVLAKSKRLVESGKDVVVILDSITRLARAYNTIAPSSGKVLTGGVDAYALQQPKRFFGAARNIDKLGSLTILGSALIETGSKMDEVIFEEFKGTGNMEINLSRRLASLRIFPAFDVVQSGTRREELLLAEDILQKVHVLRRFISSMSIFESMEIIIDKMKKTKSNAEFFELMNGKNNK